MQRQGRARFHVVRVNRMSIALLLAVALALIFWPKGQAQPASAPSGWQVPKGVWLLGHNFSGKTEQEARALLLELAQEHSVTPEPAWEGQTKDGQRYVVPELNGSNIDVGLTWSRLVSAQPNTQVEPVTRPAPASPKLSDFPNRVIRTGNGAKPVVGLLINVDWGAEELPTMLQTLRNNNAKATFFVSGTFAGKHKDLITAMHQDGHEIATHGHRLSSGPILLQQRGKLKEDIARSVAVIEGITQTKVQYYAPHMSEVNDAILKTAADLGLRTVLYSIDTVDWDRNRTTVDMILRKFQIAKAGDLILLHPVKNTNAALESALQILADKELKPLILTDVLSPDPKLPSE